MDIREVLLFYLEFDKKVFLEYTSITRPILDFLHIIFNSLFYFFLFFGITLSALYLVMFFYSLFHKSKNEEKAFIPKNAPSVTVQIPTYNETVAIRCAKKCLEFDYPKNKFEVILGDDSSDVSVSKRISAFARKHSNIRVIKRGSNIGYKSGNLNNMLEYSKGEIIVIFDSDFVPEKDFLKRIVTPFIYDPNLSAVQTRWNFIDRNRSFVSLLGSTIVTVFHHICLPFISRRAGISFLCGSAEAIRKKDLISLGKWKTGSLTEDIEFSLRLIEHGKKIEYLESVECYGEVPYTTKDLKRQQMRWAYGVTDSFKSHFAELLMSRKISLGKKVHTMLFCSGYAFSFILVLLFFTGTFSFFTHPPGPLDLSRFLMEIGR